jgi:hypothetical protein
VDGHWENTTILDELLKPVATNTKRIFTGFTAALLMDTGYYHSINQNMVEESFYGKGAGCDFVMKDCDSKSREYCSVGDGELCDYYHHGPASCTNNTYYDKGCFYRRTNDDEKCFDL